MDTIKILQLNVWTGRIKGALLEYIQKGDYDVICMQEAVWADDHRLLDQFAVSVDQIKEATGIKYDSRAANWEVEAFGGTVFQGNVILTKIPIVNEKIENVYGDYGKIEDVSVHAYTAQLVTLENGLNVATYHGYWLPDPMGDQTTVEIMRKVANLVKSADGPVVMCGDLNVVHAAPAMRELDFLTDLTEKNHVDNTLVGLKFNGKVACDHILISDGIEERSFSVPDVIVSDHKPLVAGIIVRNDMQP